MYKPKTAQIPQNLCPNRGIVRGRVSSKCELVHKSSPGRDQVSGFV